MTKKSKMNRITQGYFFNLAKKIHVTRQQARENYEQNMLKIN